MDAGPSAGELRALAGAIEAAGGKAVVEEERGRLRLPGRAFAKPDPAAGHAIGWIESREVFWYGHFRTAADLVRVLRKVRRLRFLVRVGIALVAWLCVQASVSDLAAYRRLCTLVPFLDVALTLAPFAGGLIWWVARALLRRSIRRERGVAWVRAPLARHDAPVDRLRGSPVYRSAV